MTTPPPHAPDALAPRLKSVHVGLRDDLHTTRHLFRGIPAYVVSDPLTFQSHRFEVDDYRVLTSLDPNRPLGDIFEDLVTRGWMEREQEESFYQFVFSLHRMSFLNLPVNDDRRLYRRYRDRQRARDRQKLFRILFLQIPVWNPNAFLERTIHWVRPVFSRAFFVLWVMLVGAAAYVVATRWHEFREPLNGLLAGRNFPLVWVTLIVLKVFHEFGHAYACKHYGLHVPEIGVYLIVGTPCAYVDATASWNLPQRARRIIIGLAGMYFESIIAAVAVFVWATTGPSMLNSLAYNVIFLAGVVTALFNINPLMRYDGYYIFSDLVEIPNLRRRATQYALQVAKRALLGVRAPRTVPSRSHRAILLAFGCAAPVYRVLVMVGIVAMIAWKLFWVGLAIGLSMGLGMGLGAIRRLTRYLWFAGETAPVRVRAVALSLVLLIGVPLSVALVPISTGVQAPGVVSTTDQTRVRAERGGFLTAVEVETGDVVQPGQIIARLESDEITESLASAEARLKAARIRADAYRVDDPSRAAEESIRVGVLEREVARRQTERDALVVRSSAGGRVLTAPRPGRTGHYIELGTELAVVASGSWRVRAYLTQRDMAVAAPVVGDRVEFRSAARPAETFIGTVTRIVPAGTRTLDDAPLTHVGGGDIVVAPMTGRTRQPYFQVIVTLDADTEVNVNVNANGNGNGDGDGNGNGHGDGAGDLKTGMTGRLRLGAEAEPVALHLYRKVQRFMDALRQG